MHVFIANRIISACPDRQTVELLVGIFVGCFVSKRRRQVLQMTSKRRSLPPKAAGRKTGLPLDLAERMLELRQLRRRVHNLEELAARVPKKKDEARAGNEKGRARK